MLMTDSREPLVELATQILCITLEHNSSNDEALLNKSFRIEENINTNNLFINYVARIHRDEVKILRYRIKKVSYKLINHF